MQRAIWKKTVEGNQVQSPGIVFLGSDTIVVVYLNERTLSERAAAMSDFTITSFTRARFCNKASY